MSGQDGTPKRPAPLQARSPERRLYRYLETYRRREGRFPSYREIAAGLGWKSTNTVARYIRCLVEGGRLEKDPGKARSFRLPSYRRSRYLAQEVREVEIRRADSPEKAGAGSVWIDRGWFGGAELAAWEVTGLGPFLDGILPGDFIIVDTGRTPVIGDLAAAAVGGEIVVGSIIFKGNGPRLRVSVDPDEELLFGEGTLAGDLLGRVAGILRRT
jgi:SOS-response transcriptional repressor LexA